MSSQPRYWDTNKGKVLYAIYKSQNRTYPELLTITNFQDLELRLILKELFDEELISKNGDSYWIEDYELYCEYRDYDTSIKIEAPMAQQKDAQIETLEEKWAPIKKYLEEKRNSQRIVKEILAWTLLQGINFDPWSALFR